MTRDDILRMALEAGFEAEVGDVWISEGYWADELERFAALVIAAERDACAQAAEECLTRGRSPLGRQVAEAIRARGEK